MHEGGVLGLAIILVVLVGPVLLGVTGWVLTRANPAVAAGRTESWTRGRIVNSAVLYAIAYNLIFFIQELFLVVPKALTPGLRPTLYHNNHSWAGDHPLERLFQGTGAVAIFATASIAALWLTRSRLNAGPTRLLAIWLAYHGFMQSLPQVPTGMMDRGTDVGMAMDYLGLDAIAMTALSLAALAAIPLVAFWLAGRMMTLAPVGTEKPGQRAMFIFRAAVAPALIGSLLVVPFRVPASLDAVLISPLMVAFIGISWMLATSWRTRTTASGFAGANGRSAYYPAFALAVLLAIFQLVLRPGIAFY